MGHEEVGMTVNRGGDEDAHKLGTELAASVLSIASGLFYGVAAIVLIWGNMPPAVGTVQGWFSIPIIITALHLLISILLVVGGARLMRRRASARRVVATGCIAAIIVSIVGFLTAAAYRAGIVMVAGPTAGPVVTTDAIVGTTVYVTPAVITLLVTTLIRAR